MKKVEVSKLKSHHLNQKIYGDEEISQDFLDSIDEFGILVPLKAKPDGTMISGHRRWKAAKKLSLDKIPVETITFSSKLAEREAILTYNKQRNKTYSQKMKEAEEWEEIEKKKARERQGHGKTAPGKTLSQNSDKASKGRTDEKIAEKTKIGSRDTYRKAKKVWDKAKEGDKEAQKQVEKIDKDKQSIHGANKTLQEKEEKEKRKEKKERKKKEFKKKAEEFDPSSGFEIYQGKFQEVSKQFDDESFDHIITDPPYGKKYTQLWDDLGKVAARVLKPSGFLVAMSGQITLPEAIENLSKHLDYYWTLSYIVPDDMPIVPLWERKIKAEWKPIVVFYKEPMKKQFEATSDLIEGSGNVKDKHEWEQPTKDTGKLIEKFTNPGDKLLDPMAGSGTTLVAAKNKKRECVGIEKEEKYIDIIKGRLA